MPVRVLLGLAIAAVAVVVACGHDTKPAVVEPDEHPPLPPASGTPVGYLVDDAGELKLSEDQLTKLKAIDSELSTQLDAIDAAQRGSAAPARSGQSGRHRGGGGGRRGRRGGFSNGSGSGSGTGSGSGSASASAAASVVASRRSEDRAADVRDALAKAFAILDPTQRQIATRVLSDRGIDVDAGRPAPGAAEPTEPEESGDGEAGGGSDEQPR